MSFFGDEPRTRDALAHAADEEAEFREIFQKLADAHGARLLCWVGQAYDPDQIRDQYATVPRFPKALNGVCLALTTVWIRKNLLGQVPLQAFRDKLGARGITDSVRRKQSTPTARYDAADRVWNETIAAYGDLGEQIQEVQRQINERRAAQQSATDLYKQKRDLEKARAAVSLEERRRFREAQHEATHLHANMVCSDKYFTGVPLGDQSVYAKVGTGSAAALPRCLYASIATDALYLLSFGPAGGGHVVGFTGMTHLPFRLFDPNTGEYEVPSGAAQQFFEAYWDCIRYTTVFGGGDYTLHRFSHVLDQFRTPPPPRLYPPVPWDHWLVNQFCFSYPPTFALATLPGGTTPEAVAALREALRRNEYPGQHGGLRIFVAGPDGQEWLGAVHVALEEATALVRRRRYMLEVVPLKLPAARSVEIRLYRK